MSIKEKKRYLLSFTPPEDDGLIPLKKGFEEPMAPIIEKITPSPLKEFTDKVQKEEEERAEKAVTEKTTKGKEKMQEEEVSPMAKFMGLSTNTDDEKTLEPNPSGKPNAVPSKMPKGGFFSKEQVREDIVNNIETQAAKGKVNFGRMVEPLPEETPAGNLVKSILKKY